MKHKRQGVGDELLERSGAKLESERREEEREQNTERARSEA